jgi:DNA-binding ferritin-like protein
MKKETLLLGLAGLVLMNHLKKDAATYGDIPEQASVDLADLLNHLHAIKSMAWVAHWNARGPNFYGTHLMFQRIYENMDALIDDLGERYVAYSGKTVDYTQFRQSQHSLPTNCKGAAQTILATIRQAQVLSDSARNGLTGSTCASTAGLDDYLMALNNTLDGFSYLLIRYLGSAQ